MGQKELTDEQLLALDDSQKPAELTDAQLLDLPEDKPKQVELTDQQMVDLKSPSHPIRAPETPWMQTALETVKTLGDVLETASKGWVGLARVATGHSAYETSRGIEEGGEKNLAGNIVGSAFAEGMGKLGAMGARTGPTGSEFVQDTANIIGGLGGMAADMGIEGILQEGMIRPISSGLKLLKDYKGVKGITEFLKDPLNAKHAAQLEEQIAKTPGFKIKKNIFEDVVRGTEKTTGVLEAVNKKPLLLKSGPVDDILARTAEGADFSMRCLPDKGVVTLTPSGRKIFTYVTPEEAATIEAKLLTSNLTQAERTVEAFKQTEKIATDRSKTLTETATSIADNKKQVMSDLGGIPIASVGRNIIRKHLAEYAATTERLHNQFEDAIEIFDKLPEDTRRGVIFSIEGKQPIADEGINKIVQELKVVTEGRRKNIQELDPDVLKYFQDHYSPHEWKDPELAAQKFQEFMAKRPMEGNKKFSNHQMVTLAEGLDLGLEPVTDNHVRLVLMRMAQEDKFIMSHNMMNELDASGLLKKVDISGRPPAGWKAINDVIAQVREHVTTINQKNILEESLAHGGDALATLSPQESVVSTGQYYAPSEIAGAINNYLSPGLTGNPLINGYKSVGNFMNQAQLGLSGFHFLFTSMDAAISKSALGLQEMSHGLKTLDLGMFFKGASDLVRGNIFTGTIENYIRGNRVLKQFYGTEQGQFYKDTVDRLMIAGGRVKMDEFYTNSAVEKFWEAMHTGHYGKGFAKSIPASIEYLSKPIMEHIVPRQKLGVFADLAEFEVAKLGPNASREAVAQAFARAWDSVDNRMGQLVYDNLFWNKALKDLGMMSTRSLGWNIGSARELGGAVVKDLPEEAMKLMSGQSAELTPKMAYTLALPVVVGLHGGMLHYLYTGEVPETWRDYYFPRRYAKGDPRELDEHGQPKRISLPSYMKDVFSLAHDAGRTVSHKLHPLIAMLHDLLITNTDFRDMDIRLTGEEGDPFVKQAKDVFDYTARQFVPFSGQEAQRRYLNDEGWASVFSGVVGESKAPGWITNPQHVKDIEKINNIHQRAKRVLLEKQGKR